MRPQRTKGLIVVALILVCLGLSGCEIVQGFLGGGSLGDPLPLEAYLIVDGRELLSIRAHPLDALEGLDVIVWASEACLVDWGDKSPVDENSAAGVATHKYLRQGTYEVRCWTVDDNDWKEAKLTVEVINRDPVIGTYFYSDPQLDWRQDISVWLNSHTGGCNAATGEYLYDWGMMDPDGDETRVRFNVHLVREVLVDEEVVRYEVLDRWTVFSGHDRSPITDRWVDVWAVWLRVGHAGALPPFPFATVPYESLVPDYRDESLWGATRISPMDWGGPEWPDCGDCDDPDPSPDPDPEPTPEEYSGDCFMRVKQEVIDRWGGYKHQIWYIPLNGCAYGCGGVPTTPPQLPPPGCG